MSQLIFFYGDTLGMQKDRLSSTHGERLSLHIITLPSHSEGERKEKKKEPEILIPSTVESNWTILNPSITVTTPTRTSYKLAQQPQPPADQYQA